VNCGNCGAIVNDGESYDFQGKLLCSDCYMMETNPAPKICDPLAVSAALSTRKQLGQIGTDGLTELQKKIYRAIEEKGKITKQDLAVAVGIKPEELEAQFAVLRHCELVRACKEGSIVYLIKW
jgi:hypothetical protein